MRCHDLTDLGYHRTAGQQIIARLKRPIPIRTPIIRSRLSNSSGPSRHNSHSKMASKHGHRGFKTLRRRVCRRRACRKVVCPLRVIRSNSRARFTGSSPLRHSPRSPNPSTRHRLTRKPIRRHLRRQLMLLQAALNRSRQHHSSARLRRNTQVLIRRAARRLHHRIRHRMERCPRPTFPRPPRARHNRRSSPPSNVRL